MNCFRDIIADNDFFDGVDIECINEASDYCELIQKSSEITNGVLVFNSCTGSEEDGEYRLDLVINETSFNFKVEIYSDTVDSGNMVEGLNAILKKVGYAGERRFCHVDGSVLDFGIAFISPEKEQELADNGFIWRSAKKKENPKPVLIAQEKLTSFHEVHSEFSQSKTKIIKNNRAFREKYQIGVGLILLAFLLAKFLPLNGLSTTNIAIMLGFGAMGFVGVIVLSPIPNPSGPDFKLWRMLLNGALGFIALLSVFIIGTLSVGN